MANFTHVPDKLYAYTLQVRYMFYELLNIKDRITVSTEAFEDVGVESNNSKIAEQIKSSLSDRISHLHYGKHFITGFAI